MRKHVALRTVGATRTGQWQLWPPLEAIPQSPALWAGIIYSYIRTRSPQKPPSEWVVTHALRQSWPHFLAGSPESVILKKFLASKISPDRCGYVDLLGLEMAA